MVSKRAHPTTRPAVRRVRGPLLRWYRRNRRDLPWRRTHDPYAVWVSEIMLQQTQVSAVLPYYRRFMQRFPDVHELAKAREETVLSVWSGLGYYRRARAMHRAAREVVDRHGGRVPADPGTLRSLPGIGRYTAGAVASIAYGREEPVVDGNVRRVLSRLVGSAGNDETELWDVATELVRGSAPGDLNQAIMELGALVCTPRSPECGECPMRSRCVAYSAGTPEAFPARIKARPTERVRVAVAVVRRNGRVLLERPSLSSPLRGEWDLPALELAPKADPRAAVVAGLGERHGIEVAVGARLREASHGILHRRLRLEAFDCRMLRGRTAKRRDLRWSRPADLSEIPVSGATRKLLVGSDHQKRSHGGAQGSIPASPSSSGSGSSGRARRYDRP